jgi:hypothetical protein
VEVQSREVFFHFLNPELPVTRMSLYRFKDLREHVSGYAFLVCVPPPIHHLAVNRNVLWFIAWNVSLGVGIHCVSTECNPAADCETEKEQLHPGLTYACSIALLCVFQNRRTQYRPVITGPDFLSPVVLDGVCPQRTEYNGVWWAFPRPTKHFGIPHLIKLNLLGPIQLRPTADGL